MGSIARELLGSGFSPLQVVAVSGSRNTAVAAAGATQGTATSIVSSLNVVTTCTEAASGVILPVNDIADVITVVNATSANLRVYPPVGGALSGATTNVPYTMAPNSVKDFAQTSALNYAA